MKQIAKLKAKEGIEASKKYASEKKDFVNGFVLSDMIKETILTMLDNAHLEGQTHMLEVINNEKYANKR